MATTLEQTRILQQEFHLPAGNLQNVLDVLRSEGTRLDNTMKNIGRRKFAFNLPQVMALPNQVMVQASENDKKNSNSIFTVSPPKRIVRKSSVIRA